MNGKLVQMADVKTLNDFKLLQIGWIYDINFPRAFQIVRENEYLEMIRDALPEISVRVAEIYERARAHLGRNSLPLIHNSSCDPIFQFRIGKIPFGILHIKDIVPIPYL